MQKALLMASVIIGAFLFQPSATAQQAEPNYCPLGGTYTDGKCTWPVAQQTDYVITSVTRSGATYPTVVSWNAYISSLSTGVDSYNDSCTTNQANIYVSLVPDNFTPTKAYTFPLQYKIITRRYPKSLTNGVCVLSPITETEQILNHPTGAINATQQIVYRCPPDGQSQFDQGPISIGEQQMCYYPAATPDNDDGEDCPPDTIGDCDIPDEPQCSIGGNGMEVCEADPNEKCSSYEFEGKTFYDCPTGCGFIQDQLFCTTEPDSDGEIPDFSNCFKTATAWACPKDPLPPDDNIDNPEKTLPDMTKGDFKETNKGVETRLDATNDLLSKSNAIGEATAEGIKDLNAKALAANGILRDIRQNTLETKNALYGDALEIEPDTAESILSGLGLTGDEKFSDLEKEVISLDSYRSQFNWSAGSSSCPPDRSMNLLGSSFLIDWQPYCDAFGVLGYFVKAAAFLISGFIAFGVRK